jgi:hypothetical protein
LGAAALASLSDLLETAFLKALIIFSKALAKLRQFTRTENDQLDKKNEQYIDG